MSRHSFDFYLVTPLRKLGKNLLNYLVFVHMDEHHVELSTISDSFLNLFTELGSFTT